MYKCTHSADSFICSLVIGLDYVHSIMLSYFCVFLWMIIQLLQLGFRFRESWWDYKTILDASQLFTNSLSVHFFCRKIWKSSYLLCSFMTLNFAIRLCMRTNHLFFSIVIYVNALMVPLNISKSLCNFFLSMPLQMASFPSLLGKVIFLKYFSLVWVFAHHMIPFYYL